MNGATENVCKQDSSSEFLYWNPFQVIASTKKIELSSVFSKSHVTQTNNGPDKSAAQKNEKRTRSRKKRINAAFKFNSCKLRMLQNMLSFDGIYDGSDFNFSKIFFALTFS